MQGIGFKQNNIGHAGEFLDSLLANKAAAASAPIVMSDALTSNKPSVPVAVIKSLCNSHARRQFVDMISHFPDEVEDISVRYGKIWTNEHKAAEQGLTPTERLVYHKQHSLPIMTAIKKWSETHLTNKTIEANSGLGKASAYFNKHYSGLVCFCEVEGAKLDNNEMESELKIIVRDRKNAMFHKTLHGATVGDIITSTIATGAKAGMNVFEYFTVLQQQKSKGQSRKLPALELPEKYLDFPDHNQNRLWA